MPARRRASDLRCVGHRWQGRTDAERGASANRFGRETRRPADTRTATAETTPAASTAAGFPTAAALGRNAALRGALMLILNQGQCLGAAERAIERDRSEISLADQRLFQQPVIAPLGDFHGAEYFEVLGHILRVQQTVASGLEPRDQMDQGNLGCIAGAVKHAFAEEGAAERDAIKAADELGAVIDLHRMAVPAFIERAVNATNAHVDPGARPVLLRLRAALDNCVKVAVDMDRPRR